MAQSTFAASSTQFIDGVNQTYALAEQWNLGVAYVGTTKAFARRCLAGFDVLGPAAAGRSLLPADAITSAELVLNTINLIGPSGWGAKVERIARPDWDYLTANWNRFKTGANWTAGGGDVATTPSAVAFTSPAAAGEQVIAGMAAFVTDAIANRNGKVLVRLKADVEDPAQSQWCAYTAVLSSSLRPHLRVTYVAAEAAEVDDPRAGFGVERGPDIEAPSRADLEAAPDAPSRPATILHFAQHDSVEGTD